MGENSKTALVTGATGFVGSHLVRRLLHDGWTVHIVTRPGSVRQIDQPDHSLIAHQHDGSTRSLIAIMREVKPRIVFHLASLFLARHEPEDIAPLIRSNIIFGTQLVEAMVANKIYCLINTGTAWQHYLDQGYNPVCLYAATKQAFEDVLQYYLEATPLRAINLQLFDTYGPNDKRPKLLNLLKKAAETGSPLPMSPGEQSIALVYIDDVVQAYIVAAERIRKVKPHRSETYAVSAEKAIKLKELVRKYELVSKKKIFVRWGGLAYPDRQVMTPWSKGKRLPGWRPIIKLEEGIKRIIESREQKRTND